MKKRKKRKKKGARNFPFSNMFVFKRLNASMNTNIMFYEHMYCLHYDQENIVFVKTKPKQIAKIFKGYFNVDAYDFDVGQPFMQIAKMKFFQSFKPTYLIIMQSLIEYNTHISYSYLIKRNLITIQRYQRNVRSLNRLLWWNLMTLLACDALNRSNFFPCIPACTFHICAFLFLLTPTIKKVSLITLCVGLTRLVIFMP